MEQQQQQREFVPRLEPGDGTSAQPPHSTGPFVQRWYSPDGKIMVASTRPNRVGLSFHLVAHRHGSWLTYWHDKRNGRRIYNGGSRKADSALGRMFKLEKR